MIPSGAPFQGQQSDQLEVSWKLAVLPGQLTSEDA